MDWQGNTSSIQSELQLDFSTVFVAFTNPDARIKLKQRYRTPLLLLSKYNSWWIQLTTHNMLLPFCNLVTDLTWLQVYLHWILHFYQNCFVTFVDSSLCKLSPKVGSGSVIFDTSRRYYAARCRCQPAIRLSALTTNLLRRWGCWVVDEPAANSACIGSLRKRGWNSWSQTPHLTWNSIIGWWRGILFVGSEEDLKTTNRGRFHIAIVLNSLSIFFSGLTSSGSLGFF